MTSTISLKDKMKNSLKHIFSVFRWELKFCSGSLAVYGILAGVFTTIILTLCLVTASLTSKDVENSMSIAQNWKECVMAFELISSIMIYVLTSVFTVIYTIKVFGYLHNKRQTDLYGSLPISRISLFLSKSFSAFVFSLLPSLVFMGIISLVAVVLNGGVESFVGDICINLIFGTLACISAYGLVSVCCGTTINSVIMFVSVCIVYPLTAMFIKAIIMAFFTGFYSNLLNESFIENALNPLSAYWGGNKVYWLFFTAVCVASACVLVRRRKSEHAQTSFAYYLPCHILKVLVSFFAGMFLGVLFGAIDVFGNAYLGFIFGFLLASIPAFVISHLILYKGFSKLIRTSIPLAGLIVVVIAGVGLCNMDVFGYNDYIPELEDIKSAGIVDSSYYFLDETNFEKIADDARQDYTDKKDIEKVRKMHEKITKFYHASITKPQNKFIRVFGEFIGDKLLKYGRHITVSYRLENGSSVNRVYLLDSLNVVTVDDSYDSDIDTSFCELASNETYIKKYSALSNCKASQIYYVGFYYKDEEKQTVGEASIYDEVLGEISKALKKDVKENGCDLQIIPDYYGYKEWAEEYRYAEAKYVVDIKFQKYDTTDVEIGDIKDIANLFMLSGGRNYKSEAYVIPESYTNAINVLKKYDILTKDGKMNRQSEYVYYDDEDYYDEDYYDEEIDMSKGEVSEDGVIIRNYL